MTVWDPPAVMLFAWIVLMCAVVVGAYSETPRR